jgi:hypothetical protein
MKFTLDLFVGGECRKLHRVLYDTLQEDCRWVASTIARQGSLRSRRPFHESQGVG